MTSALAAGKVCCHVIYDTFQRQEMDTNLVQKLTYKLVFDTRFDL